MSGEDALSRANEAFVEEQYERALSLYDRAVDADPHNPNYLVKRAACHVKLEEYAEAVADASRALEVEPNNTIALLRKGIACYQLHEHATAQRALERAHELDPANRQVREWLDRCRSHQPAAPEPAATTVATAPANAAPAPSSAGLRVRHDWYQTPTHVVVNILLKNTKREDVNVDIGRQSLSVDVNLATSGHGYNLELDLADLVVPDQCTWKVLPSKIEISLHKEAPVKWQTLEWTGEPTTAPKQMLVTPAAVAPVATPAAAFGASKRGPRDWDRLVTQIAEEEKGEKLEGDAALNKLFQDVYANANEETRRAMNKSFVESGGTVLSTNWKEVGAKKTEVSPPEGMEAKSFTSE